MTALDQHAIGPDGAQYPIRGDYHERFRPVVDAFQEGFERGEELGSSCSIVVRGKTVVDIWGGYADVAHQSPWQQGSTVCMMSVAKGITAIAFHMLVDRGLVDIDQPVATYWPEFAANGKEQVKVRWLLDHTAGLPILTDPLWPGAIFDRDAITTALAAQKPLWEPGTRAAYHVHNMGYLLCEIIRRVTGRTGSQFVRDEITGPLGAEYNIGRLSADEIAQIVEVIPNMDARLFAAKGVSPVEPAPGQDWTGEIMRPLAFRQNPIEPWHTTLNSAVWKSAEIASANGHGNARGVARIYASVAGGLDGVSLLSSQGMERMITEQHNQLELMQERPYHQALGVLLNSPEAVYMGPNPRSFGHHGIGGSIGFADPDAGLGFGYAINKMHAVGDNGPRARRLIDALYASLDH